MEAVRTVTLWRLVLVGLLVAVLTALFLFGVQARQPNGYSVEAYVALERPPGGSFTLGGYFDPESVTRDDEGLRFDVLASASSDTTRVTVLCEPEARISESAYWVQECYVRCRAEEGTLTVTSASLDPLILRPPDGPGRYTSAPQPYVFRRLTAQSKKAQLETLLGERLELEGVNEWVGMSVHPNAPIELYRDERDHVWIYNQPLGTWVGRLPESTDQTPGRVYPGEASREESLNRADALAREYFPANDLTAWAKMFRSWDRRVMGPEAEPIVSYDVMYQKYLNGIRMPKAISVTVYALSGGTDFVGMQVSDDVTFTIEPKVTPVRADRVVRESAYELAEDARLTDFELVVWDNVLHWRMTYELPERKPTQGELLVGVAPSVYAVDATTGELIAMPMRDVR